MLFLSKSTQSSKNNQLNPFLLKSNQFLKSTLPKSLPDCSIVEKIICHFLLFMLCNVLVDDWHHKNNQTNH